MSSKTIYGLSEKTNFMGKKTVSKIGTLLSRLKLHPKFSQTYPHYTVLVRYFWDLIHSIQLQEFANNKPSVVLYEVIVTVKGFVNLMWNSRIRRSQKRRLLFVSTVAFREATGSRPSDCGAPSGILDGSYLSAWTKLGGLISCTGEKQKW